MKGGEKTVEELKTAYKKAKDPVIKKVIGDKIKKLEDGKAICK